MLLFSLVSKLGVGISLSRPNTSKSFCTCFEVSVICRISGQMSPVPDPTSKSCAACMVDQQGPGKFYPLPADQGPQIVPYSLKSHSIKRPTLKFPMVFWCLAHDDTQCKTHPLEL